MRMDARHRFRLTSLVAMLMALQAPVYSDSRTPEFTDTQEAQTPTARPKVAVVLAGGGAKGLAHIGALKVLEEAGVPIDMVVGNSMGSIVGGLYALGYTPAEMDSVVRATDWIQLLLDAPDFGNNLLTARKLSETYQLRMSLDPERQGSKTGKGGIIQGRNISQLLTRLTATAPDSVDFNALPLPFACNATEVVSGRVYEFHSGNMVQAMRASMAIPGVFTPVQKDSLIFVDGFVTNNYPVDVARRMGADIIIGCDLVSTTPAAERYTNLLDLVTHMIDVSSTHQYEENIRQSDIYIDMDVTEYSSASFGATDIDSLITRGERRARQLLPQIEALRDKLRQQYGDSEPAYFRAHRIHHKQMEDLAAAESNKDASAGSKSSNIFRRIRSNYLKSSVNMGARFDNDEYASVHFGANVNLPTRHNFSVSLYGRLGQRLRGGLQLGHNLPNNARVGLGYLFEHTDIQYFGHGSRIADVTSDHQRTQLFFGQTWRHVLYTFGARYDWHHYTDMLLRTAVADLAPELEGRRLRYFTYFADAEYNSQNSRYFPVEGTRLAGSLQVITDNMVKYGNGAGIPIASLSWSTAYTLGSRFTMLPHASGRIIISDGTNQVPVALNNVVGGFMEGMKVDHQLTMAGLPTLEFLTENAIGIVGLSLQQRLGESHYLKCSADLASIGSQMENSFSHKGFDWGAQFGYSYSSMAGPISLFCYWSERTKEVKLMLNVGYCF